MNNLATINVSIFDKSINFSKLPDDMTRKVIREYFLTRTDYKNPSLDLQSLCRVYPDKSICDLTPTILRDTVETWSKAVIRKNFVSLLIYAAQNNYFKDPHLQRLKDFSSCINTLVAKLDYLFYIITDDRYEDFYDSSLFSDRDKRYALAIYCYSLDDNIKVNKDTQKTINEYIQCLKFSDDMTTSSKFNLIRGIDFLCNNYFNKHSCITSENAKDFICKLSKKNTTLYRSTCLCFFGIINKLHEKSLLKDNHLISIACVNTNRRTRLTSDTALEILNSEHPEYWCSKKYDKKNDTFTVFISHPSTMIRNLVCSFIANQYARTNSAINEFCKEFENSLCGKIINAPEDFCFSTFKSQAEFFHKMSNVSEQLQNSSTGVLVSFYLYLSKEIKDKLFEAEGIPTSILNRQYIVREIVSGFTIVRYNPIEEVPASDKWLFCYKKYERDSVINIKCIDFTRIESTIYRSWIKHYAWKADVEIYTKFHPIPILTIDFNYIHELKVGKQLSIFTNRGIESEITINDITAFKNMIAMRYDNNRTRSGHIYNVRNVLRHVSDNNLGKIDSGIFYTLTNTLDQTYNNARPIPNEQLGKIAKLLKEKSVNDLLTEIYSSIFFIALETEFRGSQILNLNTNCLCETAKKGEFVILSETKTSAGEVVEQPISSYVEKEIRHVISITNRFREQCTNTHLLKKIFIAPALKLGIFKKISEGAFNNYLKQCCSELGIPQYTISNLRDTHMTKAEEYRIRNQLSDVEQSILTGHSTTATDDIHYVKLNIRDMLEALHGVIIGDVKLDGKIYESLNDSIANESNEVSNGCGWCNNSSCSVMINLDCPLCKNFVTTISRLPYFEEQVRILDKKIEVATVPHDKEDLVNIKRLMLRYIEEILKKKEVVENANK